MKQVGSQKFKNSKRIQTLWKKRYNYMMNYLHQASRWMIRLGEHYDVGQIVIGEQKNVKQGHHSKTLMVHSISCESI